MVKPCGKTIWFFSTGISNAPKCKHKESEQSKHGKTMHI